MTLTTGEYRHGIGLRKFQRWMAASLKARPSLQDAQDRLSTASAKTSDVGTFLEHLVLRAKSYVVLHPGLYGSKRFAKERFLMARRKQSFTHAVVNKLIKVSEQGQGGAKVTIAYGNGKFPLSMRGCYGGTPHARLCRELARRRRVVLIDEHHTPKK